MLVGRVVDMGIVEEPPETAAEDDGGIDGAAGVESKGDELAAYTKPVLAPWLFASFWADGSGMKPPLCSLGLDDCGA